MGLVAGTDDDSNNLSIIMTARNSHPICLSLPGRAIRTISIFSTRWVPISSCTQAQLSPTRSGCCWAPLLHEFMGLAMYEDEAWACNLVKK